MADYAFGSNPPVLVLKQDLGGSLRRRDFIALAAGAMVERPFASIAQEAGRIYRFGILEPFADASVSLRRIDELRRRGFIEGQNLTIYHRDFGPSVDLISQNAAELVTAQVDVIEAAGSVATRAAQQGRPAATYLMDWIQHDHRYLALGLELIVGVGRPKFERLFPKSEAFLARRCPGPRVHLLGPDLYFDVGVRHNIAIPPWVLGRASL
jgi:hypothetical protein